MKKIALTGFENFGKNELNVTEVLVKEIIKKYPRVVNGKIVPVSYNRSYEEAKIIDGDILLHLGLASGREKISLEKFAYNNRNASLPDNDGVLYSGEKIIENGEKILKTKIGDVTIQELCNALNQKNFGSYISEDPGLYVCNNLYYLSLHYEKRPVLFIHFPPFEKISYKNELKALEIIVNFLLNHN